MTAQDTSGTRANGVAAGTAGAPTAERLAARRVTVVILVLAVSAFLMILNETVLSVALPALMAEFDMPAQTAQWLTTGFLLTMAIIIPTTGFLIRRFTTRALFATALSLFLLGTTVAALAPSFEMMLLARVLQAGGTAIIMPLLTTTTLTSVAPDRRGMFMGLNSVVISVAPAIGPTLSGIVIDAFGWRWIFALAVPLVAAALIVGCLAIGPGGQTAHPAFDALSVVLAALGFGGLVYALSSLEQILDAAAWPPLAAAVVGLAALTMFALRQARLRLRREGALLDLRPFRSREFRLGVPLAMIAMGTMLGTVTVLPLYLQDGRGVSALATGLLVLPGGLVQGVLSPFVGRLYDRFGPRPLVIPGTLLIAGAQWMLTSVGTTTPLWAVCAMFVAFSAGLGLVMTPLLTHTLSSLEPGLYPHGTAILSTLQQLAGAAGTAALVAALTIGAAATASEGAAADIAEIAGTRGAFVVGGVLSLLAVAGALFIRRIRREQPPRV
ncbi:MAG: MDR family MFS transporter [Microbacterium sp.]